jgi:agmatine deiminase
MSDAALERVRFLPIPTDDIWVRDHGPIVGLNGEGQRVALGAIYDHLPQYPQTRDDAMPVRWSAHSGIPLRPVDLHNEGGNLISDGQGTLIMTDKVLPRNPQFTRRTFEDYLHTMFDYDKLILTPRLRIETTGHVDLLVKLADAETVLLSRPNHPVLRGRLGEAVDLFRRETNAHGQRYRVETLPTPDIYWNWFVYPIRRSYTNALTVNGRVLVPVYGIASDDEALATYARVLPEYNICPIDARVGANGGGAVHCLTKEVPAATPR